MEPSVEERVLLWEPSEQVKQQANITRYMKWLESEKGVRFSSPEELWTWSVNSLEDFWASLWEYYQIKASKPYTTVLEERKMPGATWFVGAELNYTEQVFRHTTSSHPALLFQSERHPLTDVRTSSSCKSVCPPCNRRYCSPIYQRTRRARDSPIQCCGKTCFREARR
jgi:acetoacetyl-CoA synthetase